MVDKILRLAASFIKGELIFDHKALGLKRERLFKVPQITNYIRISNFELVVQEINDRNVPGNVAELGVYKGEFAKYINQAFPSKTLYLFDTFEGFNEKDIHIEREENFSQGDQNFSDTSVNDVLAKMKYPDKCVIHKGYFPESLNGLEDEFCFVSLDPDLYKPIYDGLEYFYPRLSKGGYIFIHDYNNSMYSGAKKAVRDFCNKKGIAYTPIADAWGTVVIAK